MTESGAAESVLRRGLLGLAIAGSLGIFLELAVARHWNGWTQRLPWVVSAIILAATLAVALAPGRATIRAARVLAGLACAAGLFGVWQHVEANYDAAPLDQVYGPKWDAMSEASRWWNALIESVGPSPSFAPGILALVAACLLLATVGHPVLRGQRPT